MLVRVVEIFGVWVTIASLEIGKAVKCTAQRSSDVNLILRIEIEANERETQHIDNMVNRRFKLRVIGAR